MGSISLSSSLPTRMPTTDSNIRKSSASRLNREESERNLIRKSDLYLNNFKQIKIFSKQSMNWLFEALKFENGLNFVRYHYYSTLFGFSDEAIYESFSSLLVNFFKSDKGDFKICSGSIEIFGLHRHQVLDEVMAAKVGELHDNDQLTLQEKLKKFKNFLVLKPKSKTNQFIERLYERRVPLIKIEKQTRVGEEGSSKYYIIYGKNLNMTIHLFIEYAISKNNNFEIYASFPFSNSMAKRADLELSNVSKNSVIFKSINVLSDKLMRRKIIRLSEVQSKSSWKHEEGSTLEVAGGSLRYALDSHAQELLLRPQCGQVFEVLPCE